MTDRPITLQDLRTVDLFDDLTDDELAPWVAATLPFDVAAGESVTDEETSPRGLMLILEGTLQALMAGDGPEEPISRHVAPTWAGAIPALTGTRLGVRLRALTACRIGLIPRERFVDLVLASRPVHERVMRQVAPVLSRVSAVEQNRERLASLGTMAAGLAHELNNPAAAAKRSASQLIEALDTVNGTMAAFVDGGVELEQARRLVVLQKAAVERAATREPVSGLAAADAEDELLEALEELGVDEPWRLAEPLAAAGLDRAWLAEVADLAGAATGAAIAWVAASVTAHALADELHESAKRMSTLVGAVKTYAYMDRGEIVDVDLHEGLDTTLVMLGHKLKHTTIEVVRDYDRELPRLLVHGSELNQVWTNLIDNAIDALGEGGTITLRTRQDDGCAVVEVADDGPGIPAEDQSRVLEPFFTTKPVGQGTGLGLDAVRRIVVDRHEGSVAFDSGPEGTTFRVRLPLRPREAQPAGEASPNSDL